MDSTKEKSIDDCFSDVYPDVAIALEGRKSSFPGFAIDLSLILSSRKDYILSHRASFFLRMLAFMAVFLNLEYYCTGHLD